MAGGHVTDEPAHAVRRLVAPLLFSVRGHDVTFTRPARLTATAGVSSPG